MDLLKYDYIFFIITAIFEVTSTGKVSYIFIVDLEFI
jgi:hypothetical protein